MRDIEKYTKDYLCDGFENVMVFYRKKKVFEFLDKYQPKNVLEIGCGLVSVFEEYKKFNNFVVVEPSTVFCDQVKKSQHFTNKVEVINDFFENKIEYLSKKNFDFIICSSLLHEVPDPNVFLKGMRQICSNDTIVHINVPNSESFHFLLALESNIIEKLGVMSELRKKMQTNTVFDIKKLKNIAIKQNFNVIESGSYFIKLFNYTKMRKALDVNIFDPQILDGLYGLSRYFPKNGAEIFVNCRKKQQ